MVKNIALALAIVASLTVADEAFARGRKGCKSCGGCPGGVCYVPASSEKQAATNAPPSGESAPVVTAAPAAQTYYYANTGRRGLFGRR